jgi:hypothetical protein
LSYVQQHDETKGVWLLFHVATGDIITTSHQKFDEIDEIQPIKRQQPQTPPVVDPLGAFR